MRPRRAWLRWIGGSLVLLVLVGVALAPAWRNYHLPRRSVRIVRDVGYVAGADAKHQLDLYLPTTKPPRPWPVVVFVHGGFWKPFDRRMLQPITGLHGCVGVALANEGVATAVLSYRQRPEAASFQDALDDLTRAVRWVVDNIPGHGGDPGRVYVVGHSAGALFASLLATQPEHLAKVGVTAGHVRGFAALAGPYDLGRLASFHDESLASKVRASLSAGDVERYSPERQVRAGGPPLLLLVGADEDPFLIAEQRSMAAALRAVGGDVTAEEVPGEDHMGLVMHLSQENDRTRAALLQLIQR